MSDEALKSELSQRGLAGCPGLLGRAQVDALRRAIESLRRTGSAKTTQILYTHRVPAEPRPPFSELMEQWLDPHLREGGAEIRAVLDPLANRLSSTFPGMRLLQDVLLIKQPWHREFAWHQDEPFWPWDAAEGLVLWCALDHVDRRNGAVEFAVGSHAHGRGPAIDLHTGEPQCGGPRPDLASYDLVCPPLAPGDAVLFSARLWHRSGRNLSRSPRRAWSSAWLPSDAVWRPDRAPRHPHVRGSTDAGGPGARIVP